jgi:phage recombination protein Bet
MENTMSKELSTATETKPSLVSKFASRYGVEPDKIMGILKATAFKPRKQETVITNEQMAALLIVADQYGLNPFTKEIFAFEDKGAIIPIVSVDGWVRIINENAQMDGIEFRYSTDMDTMPDSKPCHAWIECIITRKDRKHPIIVREYLDETYQGKRNGYAGPWQSHTKRMLRHKALIQCGRVAFGFSGIYDEDEGDRIIQATEVKPTGDKPKTLRGALGMDDKPKVEEVHDAEFVSKEDAPPPLTVEDVKQRLNAATNEDEVNAAWELIEIEKVDHTKEQHKELGTLYTERMKQLHK